MNKFKIYFICSIILIISLVAINLTLIYQDFREKTEPFSNMPVNHKNCENLSIEDTAFCLKNFIKPFYNYSMRTTTHKRTFQDIKDNGGDCKDYSMLYLEFARSLGYNADYQSTSGIWDENHDILLWGHKWAIMWDNETYCKLDQMNVECFKRKIKSPEIKFTNSSLNISGYVTSNYGIYIKNFTDELKEWLIFPITVCLDYNKIQHCRTYDNLTVFPKKDDCIDLNKTACYVYYEK